MKTTLGKRRAALARQTQILAKSCPIAGCVGHPFIGDSFSRLTGIRGRQSPIVAANPRFAQDYQTRTPTSNAPRGRRVDPSSIRGGRRQAIAGGRLSLCSICDGNARATRCRRPAARRCRGIGAWTRSSRRAARLRSNGRDDTAEMSIGTMVSNDYNASCFRREKIARRTSRSRPFEDVVVRKVGCRPHRAGGAEASGVESTGRRSRVCTKKDR